MTAHDAARVATAGFVLARLLDEAPNEALAAMFVEPERRATWPLRDEDSLAALASITAERPVLLSRDHARLFRGSHPLAPARESAWREGTGREEVRSGLVAIRAEAQVQHPPPAADDRLAEHVALLAGLATRVRAGAVEEDEETRRTAAAAADRLRRERLDDIVGPFLDGIDRHATTTLYRALPVLMRGFLTAHADLCAAVTGAGPEPSATTQEQQ